MEERSRLKLYLVTFSVSTALLTLGAMSSWTTPVLLKFSNNETKVEITKYETGWMTSLNPVGFVVGSLVTGYIADRFGRRTTILLGALPIAFGSVIALFAFKAWLLYIVMLLWNSGSGMISTVSGLYISEIAGKDERAKLSVVTSIMFKLGNLIIMCVGPFTPYDILNIIMLVLPCIFFIVCWWIPESPYYYLKNGNTEAARVSLRTLRGYKVGKVLDDELLSIQGNVKKEISNSSSFKELFSGSYKRALYIGFGLKLTQILSGGVLIKQYFGLIIKETKLTWDMYIAFIIYAVVGFGVSFASSFFVDRVGRRPLLIYSYTGTGLSLAIAGFYFFFQDVIKIEDNILTTYGFVPLLGINLANVISTIGFNSLIFIIPAEIFPINVRAKALMLISVVGSFAGAIIPVAYLRIKDYCGMWIVFLIFALFSISGAVHSYFIVIETKGKNFEDIQMELQGKAYEVVAVNDNTGQRITEKYENGECTEMDELKRKSEIDNDSVL